jgi:hypothetical protein
VLGALVLGILFGTATGQIFGVDLNRLIQESIRRSVAVVSVTPSQQNMSHKAVYQYGLAPVIVGLSPNGLPIGYRLVLLATVPANIAEADEVRVRSKIAGIVYPIALQLRNDIDSLPGREEPDATAAIAGEDVQKHFDDYAAQKDDRAHEMFVAASLRFKQQFGRSFPKYEESSFLAIALRPCADPVCPLNEFAHSRRNRSTDRFGKLYGWMKLKGMTTVNQAYILNPQGSFWSITAKLDKGFQWHDDFPKAALQSALVNAAKRARRTEVPLQYSAAELAGLSREAAAHIADVFDSSYAAAIHLPSGPNALLAGISDEIGRARLTECVRLRGAFDPSEAGACAGYNLTQPVLAACLSGGECAPPFGDHVNFDSLTVNAHTNLAYFAQNAALPRVNLGTIDEVAEIANKCKNKKGVNPGYCLIKTSLSRDQKTATTLACIGSLGNGAGALTNCVVADVPKETQAQIACFQRNSSNYRGLALCAAANALPPTAQKFIGCASNAKQTSAGFEDAAACLSAPARSHEAECLLKYKGTWQDAALCMGGDRVTLPPQVKSALHCADKADSLSAFGGCMVASEGSGEVQRIAACYAEGQGVPAAVAVCLAAKNLTQDQRMVLECAAETNGAPHATAICAGGKMATKEMINCQRKNFGEDKCFGEGNELRKLTKSLGVEIGPHSVVADIVNVQLRISDVTTTPVLNVVNQVLPEVLKIATDNGLNPIPDLQHLKPADVLGPVAAPLVAPVTKAIDNYCDHNWCPGR